MHGMDNFQTFSAYCEVMLLQRVQHTDELSLVILPVFMLCCGHPVTGPNFSTYIECQMNF
jgi:hypothetical protein